MPRGPEPDEFPDGIKVGGVAEKFVGLFILHRAAEPGGDRIDEHQIAVRQQGIFIVHQAERRRRQRAVLVHLHPARAERAEVQPDGRRAGTAVETKRDRPPVLRSSAATEDGRRFVGLAHAGISHVKDGGAGTAVGLEQRQHSGLGHIGDVLAGNGHAVGGQNRLVRGIGNLPGFQFRGGRLVGAGGGRIGFGRIGGVQAGREGDQEDPAKFFHLKKVRFRRQGKCAFARPNASRVSNR